jgi:hypothetical protein
VQGGDQVHLGEVEEGELARELGLDLLALVGGQPVPLVDRDHQCPPRSMMCPASVASCSPTPSCASSTRMTTLAASIAWSVLMTLNFSITSSIRARRRMPAVSIRV